MEGYSGNFYKSNTIKACLRCGHHESGYNHKLKEKDLTVNFYLCNECGCYIKEHILKRVDF